MRIAHAMSWPLRAMRRLALAGRYWLALDYSWHLAWIKSERPS